MNQWFYYIIQFIIGGGSVVGITLIAKYLNPKYTGILYALPAILIVAIIFIYLDQGLLVSRRTLKSTFVYEFTLIFFILGFYFLLEKFGFWQSLTISFLGWAVLATLIQFIFKL